MCAILQLGFWKMCRAGIATPSTQGCDRPPQGYKPDAPDTRCLDLRYRLGVAGWHVNFRDDVYKHDETLDRDALADVAAGGFAVPALAGREHHLGRGRNSGLESH